MCDDNESKNSQINKIKKQEYGINRNCKKAFRASK